MLLLASNIQKKYTQGASTLQVLKGIDLEVMPNDVVAIVGPSGAGKSTLLHILGGLDRPTDGQVVFDDLDLYAVSDRERAACLNEKIGFVFQFYHLLPEFTALENVMLPALIRSNLDSPDTLRARGTELLTKVGLKDRLMHKPSQLSGGEQQRVAIARALINDPLVIMCDEPTGNLDSQTGAGIIEILLDFNVTQKKALVIVTHDDQIAKRAKRTIQMKDGRLI